MLVRGPGLIQIDESRCGLRESMREFMADNIRDGILWGIEAAVPV